MSASSKSNFTSFNFSIKLTQSLKGYKKLLLSSVPIKSINDLVSESKLLVWPNSLFKFLRDYFKRP